MENSTEQTTAAGLSNENLESHSATTKIYCIVDSIL